MDTSSKNFESEFKIEGYELFHEDRKGRRGGGGAIYVKDSLRFTVNNPVRADVNSRVNLGRYFKGERKTHSRCTVQDTKP